MSTTANEAGPLCYTITWEGPRFPGVAAIVVVQGSFSGSSGDDQQVSWTWELRKDDLQSSSDGASPGVNNAFDNLGELLSRLRRGSYLSAWSKSLLRETTDNPTSQQAATACVAELLRSGPTASPMAVHVLEPDHLTSGRDSTYLWGDRVMPLGPNGPPPLQDNSASQSNA